MHATETAPTPPTAPEDEPSAELVRLSDEVVRLGSEVVRLRAEIEALRHPSPSPSRVRRLAARVRARLTRRTA
ncbi:hypothetical protein [Agromyces rhizosphaerae]|uniref:hypothetical protein n=1 Tax=Agromyces rhizosphaerae TaxID=88374 RepID=UPI002492A26B|nr:hypothetical protein [Agromyces rhizosphaerae]